MATINIDSDAHYYTRDFTDRATEHAYHGERFLVFGATADAQALAKQGVAPDGWSVVSVDKDALRPEHYRALGYGDTLPDAAPNCGAWVETPITGASGHYDGAETLAVATRQSYG